MANNNTAYVTAGKPKVGGAVFRAPVGTTLPTDATTALNAAFVNLGFVSEDGVTNESSPESSTVKEWGGSVVLTTWNGRTDTFKMKLLEALNPEVLKTVFGASNVTETSGALAVSVGPENAEEYSYVIETVLKGGRLCRLVIPRGTVSEVGERTFVSSDAIAYDLTLTANEDGNGCTHKEYISAAA